MSAAIPNRNLGEDYGPDSGGRLKNITIVKPILIGCRSRKLPQPIPNPHPGPSGNQNAPTQDHSHQWTLYVRPYNNEDISVWIKKVQFKLHDTYPNCNRITSSVPFEVEETGWGEFEVQIKIFFVDPNERQVTLWTWVRLFKKETETNMFYDKDGSLVYEYYDELVFVEPSAMMLDYLNTPKKWTPNYKPEVDYDKRRIETIQNIRKARDRITPEIQAMSAQFEAYKSAYSHVMAILRGETHSIESSRFPATMGSEYGGSVATSSQASHEPSVAD